MQYECPQIAYSFPRCRPDWIDFVEGFSPQGRRGTHARKIAFPSLPVSVDTHVGVSPFRPYEAEETKGVRIIAPDSPTKSNSYRQKEEETTNVLQKGCHRTNNRTRARDKKS